MKIKNTVTVCVAAVIVFGLLVFGFAAPDEKLSVSERRPLADFPQLSAENVMSGKFSSDFETYSLDRFPLRDIFRTLKAVTSLGVMRRLDNNGIYMSGGYLSKLEYPLDSASLDRAAARFEFIYDTFLKDKNTKIYSTLIPDKNFFLAQSGGYPSMDYDEFARLFCQKAPYMNYIDIYGLLDIFDYYRTDTHWSQDKLADVAQRLAFSMDAGFEAEYDKKTLDRPFYGVYYGQSALPLQGEEMSFLTNLAIENMRVYDYETDSFGAVYDTEKAGGTDMYEMFLSGSKSLLKIENPACSDGKRLVVFRDSFGSSLIPLLAQGYSEITVVDIRYIASAMLGNFIDFENSDVLFMYSTSVLNNSVTLK